MTTLVEAVELVPARNRTTQNTGNAWVGPASAAGSNLRELRPVDQPYVITAPPGKKIDLRAIYVEVATNGDGVIWTAVN